MLARDTGAIVHTSGFTSSNASTNPNSALPAPPDNAANGAAAATAVPLTNGKESGMRSAEDVARMVHSFVEAAGELVKNLEEEDEVKLLRLRTKKNELVIVPGKLPVQRKWVRVGERANSMIYPDPRFMIVVVHDTPLTP